MVSGLTAYGRFFVVCILLQVLHVALRDDIIFETIKEIIMIDKEITMHPGAYLMDAYMKPLGITVTCMAKKLGVSKSTVSRLVGGKSSVSVDMAIRLSIVLGTTVESWLIKQVHFDKANFDYSKFDGLDRSNG